MPANSIPILTYHSLDPSRSVVSTSPLTFGMQMERLHEAGYRTLSLRDAGRHIREGDPFPDKSFVITFDDGYESVFTHAFPVLRRHQYMCTMFLIGGYSGKLNDWPGQPSTIPRLPLLTWSQVKEMHGYGIELGAHTMTHPDLTRTSVEEAEEEIVHSKAVIEERTGAAVGAFAFPYGRRNARIDEIVRAHFELACSTRLGKANLQSSPYQLERVDMYYFNNPRAFGLFQTPLFDGYLRARRVLRGVRRVVR